MISGIAKYVLMVGLSVTVMLNNFSCGNEICVAEFKYLGHEVPIFISLPLESMKLVRGARYAIENPKPGTRRMDVTDLENERTVEGEYIPIMAIFTSDKQKTEREELARQLLMGGEKSAKPLKPK
jgi:hypothetical protein